jgi:putative nucleotidyltransferase with HDIG domain
MLKKISVSDLRVGMYVEDLQCRWIDHPFAVNRFLINSDQQIEKILKAGVRELIIDTSRGCDVAVAPVLDDLPTQIDDAVLDIALEPPQGEEAQLSLEEEMHRAAEVRENANRVVTGIMEDVRLGKQIEIEKVNPVVEEMVASVLSNQDALLGLTRIRQMDQYTFEHSVSVSVLLTTFGKHLGLSREELVDLGIGGLLHDIGKIKTPQHILNKPGKLTDEELMIMRRHVVYSREILGRTPGVPEIALKVAAEHHERVDGSGYPDGKDIGAISLYGQMAAIVDVYDAITADRCYHKGMTPHQALQRLMSWGKSHLNSELVQRFIHCVGIYPIGTLVALSNGNFAVVMEKGLRGLLLPKIRIFFDPVSRRFLEPEDVDLSLQDETTGLQIVSSEDPEKWRLHPEQFFQSA